MEAAGMESIIIKVAGAGLGRRHLGKNVCSEEMRDELEILVSRRPSTEHIAYLLIAFRRKGNGALILQEKVENTKLSQSIALFSSKELNCERVLCVFEDHKR